MNATDALSTLSAVGRAVIRWERPDQLISNVLVTGAMGPTLAGAVAGAAARDAGRIAVDDGAVALTYGGLWRAAQAVAKRCRDEGVRSHDTIGLLAGNTAEFVVAAVACSVLGVDVVYLNTGFAAPQLAEVIGREGITRVLVDQQFAESPVTHHRLVTVPVDRVALDTAVPAEPPRGSALARAVGGQGLTFSRGLTFPWLPSSPPVIPSRRPARQVILTSGTTGTPKGAGRSGANAAGIGFFRAVPLKSGDRVVIACPLFHAWGLSHLLLGLALGSTLRLADPSDVRQIVGSLGKRPNDPHGADGLVVVPVVLQRLLDHLDAAGGSPDKGEIALRYVVSSGSALPIGVVRRSLDRFGPVLYNVYGSTEAALATVAGPVDLARYPTTAGRAVPGTQVTIRDGDRNEVRRGTSGRVFVDSGNAFDGYTGGGDKERMGSAVDTGDVGRMIGDLLFVEGRSDDMIICGGENVFPGEVERLIEQLDGVADVAVVGVDDAEFGQRLAALVVAAPTAAGGGELNADHITEAVRDRLARFKVPRDVLFVDQLPRTESGKVRRGRVAEIISDAVTSRDSVA